MPAASTPPATPAVTPAAVRRRLLPLVAAAGLVAALGLTACSNSESAPQKRPHTGSGAASMVDGVQQITVVTGADLRFHPSTLVVHPGKVEIIMENKVSGGSGGPPHNLEVSGLPGAFIPLTAAGDVGKVTFTAGAPGRYHFVCTIHVQEGQTGTLVVEPASGAGSTAPGSTAPASSVSGTTAGS